MHFIADENFPFPSVKLLRDAGHDVAAVIRDSPGATDEEVLSRAVRERGIILTFDRDFGELIFRRGISAPPSVVYFRFDPATPAEPAEYLLRLLEERVILLEDRFTVAEREQVRQRRLR